MLQGLTFGAKVESRYSHIRVKSADQLCRLQAPGAMGRKKAQIDNWGESERLKKFSSPKTANLMQNYHTF